MAAIKFTAADVAKLLGLPDTQAVQPLITAGTLRISAYTRRGRPLFDVDSVRRAAEHVIRPETSPA